MPHLKAQTFAPSKDTWEKKMRSLKRGKKPRCWRLQVKSQWSSASSGDGAAPVTACQGTGPGVQERCMQMHTISINQVIFVSDTEVLQ